MNKREYRHFIVILISIFIIAVIFSCLKKDIKKTETKDPDAAKTTVSHDNDIDRTYLSEGFLSDSQYRVVIISTREECEGNVDDIKEKSRKRLIISLEKYLVSINKKIDANTRVKIQNILNQYGRFSIKDKTCHEKNIFYYDVEKNDLKDHLSTLFKW